jgi:hypothetical protein
MLGPESRAVRKVQERPPRYIFITLAPNRFEVPAGAPDPSLDGAAFFSEAGKVMSPNSALYKFSVTIHTDDLAVVECLRGLAKFSQKTGNNRIAWSRTKLTDWERNGHCVTFRFSSPSYRHGFKSELTRLLPDNLWQIASESDSNPPRPER